MKPITGIKNKWLVYSAAVVLGTAALASFARAEPVMQTAGQVAYVSGGVGTESIERLTAQADEFNLKLVFALNSGEFVSGVKVIITDDKGQAVLDAVSEGPWFLARLPVGKYQIVASLADKAERRSVNVGAAKLMTVDFRWAAN
ncbi:carboxypeptidase-like regulatory domain-containing protein [Propionivibrio sp.]|uniref:carboxypeptidase-like regulatory domain-containing protein n=1 Tax=Propionivibrio sp. TaxID=2212460 RepID=UPI002601879A|nr:carboxypeptidase-like regulatory domain-containing protein [Propionivibrio sp.]